MRIRYGLSQLKRPADWWLLARIVALSSALPVMLRWVKLPTLLRVLSSRHDCATAQPEQVDKIVRFTWFVLSKNRLAGRNTCLKRSLLLYHFLGRAGLDVEIDFGVQRAGGLTGHSWLTRNGEVYLGSEAVISDYAVVYSSRELK